jgi:DNA-directed RNA polymerase specialized sigma24 family protein
MYRAAWALCGRREDAEDLVQETFARVLARPRIVHGEDETYYLMRALRNTFYTSTRTASRRPVTGAGLEDGMFSSGDRVWRRRDRGKISPAMTPAETGT